jgi:hypothetical protein
MPFVSSFTGETSLPSPNNYLGTSRIHVVGSAPWEHSAGYMDGSAAVPVGVKLRYLAVYFVFNLGLTVFNKVVMGNVSYVGVFILLAYGLVELLSAKMEETRYRLLTVRLLFFHLGAEIV